MPQPPPICPPLRLCHSALNFPSKPSVSSVGLATEGTQLSCSTVETITSNYTVGNIKNVTLWSVSFSWCTCVSHVTETHSRDAISMSPAVVRTLLWDVNPIQSKRWSIFVNTALLEPTEPCFAVTFHSKTSRSIIRRCEKCSGYCHYASRLSRYSCTLSAYLVS